MGKEGDDKSGEAKALREAKLAQALRDNLRRRKASGARPAGKTSGGGESS